jgi:hypothetical protein
MVSAPRSFHHTSHCCDETAALARLGLVSVLLPQTGRPAKLLEVPVPGVAAALYTLRWPRLIHPDHRTAHEVQSSRLVMCAAIIG